jgi:hypothetical protein
VAMAGAAIRHRLDVVFRGPGGEGRIPLLLFLPATASAAAPVPVFLLICNRNRENIAADRSVRSPSGRPRRGWPEAMPWPPSMSRTSTRTMTMASGTGSMASSIRRRAGRPTPGARSALGPGAPAGPWMPSRRCRRSTAPGSPWSGTRAAARRPCGAGRRTSASPWW